MLFAHVAQGHQIVLCKRVSYLLRAAHAGRKVKRGTVSWDQGTGVGTFFWFKYAPGPLHVILPLCVILPTKFANSQCIGHGRFVL